MKVALRPRWIALLVLVLVIASVFAWLGKWQLERAVEQGQRAAVPATDTAAPLNDVLQPGKPLVETAAGRLVTFNASFVPGDFRIVSDRMNGGVKGYWVIGHLVTADSGVPASLAAAVGWAATRESAENVAGTLNANQAADVLVAYTGRLQPNDDPGIPAEGTDPAQILTMNSAQLINVWSTVIEPVYVGYVVMQTPTGALQKIDSAPPVSNDALSWLNIFYAVEWILLAAGAFYLWYRLVKDAHEREQEQLREKLN